MQIITGRREVQGTIFGKKTIHKTWVPYKDSGTVLRHTFDLGAGPILVFWFSQEILNDLDCMSGKEPLQEPPSTGQGEGE